MSGADPSPVFDSFDLDLVVNVLVHTVFSPFFVFFIPVFHVFQGARVTDPVVLGWATYYLAVSLFWLIKWYSRLYRNQGSLFFAPKRLDWGEQIVVVTGGASGVGELLANTLAARNVTVVVLDVNPIVTEYDNIAYYKCDVSSWEEVQAVAKTIKEEIGDPTVLVNNAGVVQGKLILDLSPEDTKQTFGVNTLAHFWTLKAFLPAMIQKKEGHIVSVSSIMGVFASAQMTDYCASKASIIALDQSLRYELDHRYNCPNIRTTLVCPAWMPTQMFSTVKWGETAFFRFIFPPVQVVTVVKAIIASLDARHSQRIDMPFFATVAAYLNLLPSFLRDFAQWVTGADYAMEGFVKITGRRPGQEADVPLPSNDKKSD